MCNDVKSWEELKEEMVKIIDPVVNFIEHRYIKCLLTVSAQIAIVIAVITFYWEMNDRSQDRLFRAWDIVYSASGKGGSGMVKALEYLNEEEQSFYRLDLSNAILDGINLEEADLEGVILNKASLRNANLKGAILREADISYADFCGADLRDSDLRGLRSDHFPNEDKKLIESGLKIKGANIYGACFTRIFIEWALKNGAVEIKENDRWPSYEDHSLSTR